MNRTHTRAKPLPRASPWAWLGQPPHFPRLGSSDPLKWCQVSANCNFACVHVSQRWGANYFTSVKKKKVPDTQGWLSVVLCKEQHLCKRWLQSYISPDAGILGCCNIGWDLHVDHSIFGVFSIYGGDGQPLCSSHLYNKYSKWTKLSVLYLYIAEIPRWCTETFWGHYTLTHLCRRAVYS